MKSVFTTGVVAPAESGGPEPASPLSPGEAPAWTGGQPLRPGCPWFPYSPQRRV